jgi:hypothetical protein
MRCMTCEQAGKWLRLIGAAGGPIQCLSTTHQSSHYWIEAFALEPSFAAHMAKVGLHPSLTPWPLASLASLL